MYKHILLPTDGSELSRQAVQSAVLFAKNVGATVTGIYVAPLPHLGYLDAWMHHDADFAEHKKALFDKFATEYLSFVANSALAEGVPCACKEVEADEPYKAILSEAERSRCDLIFMASHGWRGDTAQLLGSVTLKVLTYSKIPVLAHKPPVKD
ncbi:MAG TPA: universal stress protein [Burkholderiaceae bacterium]|jgi:nucleotide-binding universal stress UspA family protein|nr:universal stress protein [Burkholderiaceae bacterium]